MSIKSEIKSKRLDRVHQIVIASALTCIQSVSAENEVQSTVKKHIINGGTVKSEKLTKQSQPSKEERPSSAGLNISSPGEISNTQSINATGSVNINAGKSITNGSLTAPASIKASSSVTMKAPRIHNSGTISAGSGNITMSTANLVNSGSISAPSGNINISNDKGNSLLINNANGAITGKAVTLKVNDSDKSGSENIVLTGGTISGETITIGGNDTKINIDADKINGQLNVTSSSAKIHSKH